MTWVNLDSDELDELLSPKTALFAPTRDGVRRRVHDKLKAAQERPDHKLLADSFSDARGLIKDLIDGPIDAVTWIRTVEGAVRGNHLHERTTQWTYVLTGRLLVSHAGEETHLWPGEVVVDEPGVPHAWKALADTDCLVFTHGPRSGDQYESDTSRLDVPLLS